LLPAISSRQNSAQTNPFATEKRCFIQTCKPRPSPHDYWPSKSFGDCREYKTRPGEPIGYSVPDFFIVPPETLLKAFQSGLGVSDNILRRSAASVEPKSLAFSYQNRAFAISGEMFSSRSTLFNEGSSAGELDDVLRFRSFSISAGSNVAPRASAAAALPAFAASSKTFWPRLCFRRQLIHLHFYAAH
jgi:hypothetical protein